MNTSPVSLSGFQGVSRVPIRKLGKAVFDGLPCFSQFVYCSMGDGTNTYFREDNLLGDRCLPLLLLVCSVG